MKTCWAVYSCWTTGDDGSWARYDHPTPVGQDGELPRLLANFAARGITDRILVFPGPTDPRIEAHLQRIVDRFPQLDVHVLTGADIARILRTLADGGFPATYADVMNVDQYGRLRNMSLLYAIMHGFDNVIQIDDDELIEDPAYLTNALGDMGKDFKGQPIYGKSGYYVDAAGTKYYDGQMSVTFPTWPKDERFNEAVKNAFAAQSRLSDCHVAFGGNMAINRKLFLHVPYDQIGLPRGEDDDYVMNARKSGYVFVFDAELWIRHLPPKRDGLYWARPRQDIKRFKYLREKIRLFGHKPEDMGVFFDYFLREDLEYKAVTASIAAYRYYQDKDRAEAEEFLNNALVAVEPNRADLRQQAERQLRFMDDWARVMPKVEGAWKR
ncbi:MAG: hypothetical protein WCR06_00760 [bacterium]